MSKGSQNKEVLLEKKRINPESSKEKKIEDELNRISVFFEEVDTNKRSVISPLLQNAAFMKVTLEELQEIINAEGVTDHYQNGANQYGIKQSATLQSYNALIKNYASVVKTLAQMLPPEKRNTYTPWEYKEKTPEEIEADRIREEEHQRQLREELQRAVEEQKRRNAEWEARKADANR